MTKEYHRKFYSIRLPDTWKVDEDPESALLSGPDSYGTLQLWSYHSPSGPLSDEYLLSFAADVIQMGVASHRAACGGFTGFRFDYPKGDVFFRRWCLQCGPTIISASYFCPVANQGKADQIVDRIMSTLRRIEEGPTNALTHSVPVSEPPQDSSGTPNQSSPSGSSHRVIFKPALLSIDLGESWVSLGDSENPPVCSPRLLSEFGLLQAMLLEDDGTNISQAADKLQANLAKTSGAVANSFKREYFTADSGLNGIHISYSAQLPDKTMLSHSFIAQNPMGRFIKIEYISPAGSVSKEVLEAIRKTLKAE